MKTLCVTSAYPVCGASLLPRSKSLRILYLFNEVLIGAQCCSIMYKNISLKACVLVFNSHSRFPFKDSVDAWVVISPVFRFSGVSKGWTRSRFHFPSQLSMHTRELARLVYSGNRVVTSTGSGDLYVFAMARTLMWSVETYSENGKAWTAKTFIWAIQTYWDRKLFQQHSLILTTAVRQCRTTFSSSNNNTVLGLYWTLRSARASNEYSLADVETDAERSWLNCKETDSCPF